MKRVTRCSLHMALCMLRSCNETNLPKSGPSFGLSWASFSFSRSRSSFKMASWWELNQRLSFFSILFSFVDSLLVFKKHYISYNELNAYFSKSEIEKKILKYLSFIFIFLKQNSWFYSIWSQFFNPFMERFRHLVRLGPLSKKYLKIIIWSIYRAHKEFFQVTCWTDMFRLFVIHHLGCSGTSFNNWRSASSLASFPSNSLMAFFRSL